MITFSIGKYFAQSREKLKDISIYLKIFHLCNTIITKAINLNILNRLA